ncbi:MAG: cyclic nucleotide-binding domain-containing protein [Acidobacteriota bacterium]
MSLFGKGKGEEDPLVLMKQGCYERAASLLERKLQREPRDLALKVHLAEAYEGAGRPEEAARIYRDEGEARLAGGRRSEGLALLRRAVRLAPEDAVLARRMAELEGGGQKAEELSAFFFDLSAGPALEPEGQVTVAPDGPGAEAGPEVAGGVLGAASGEGFGEPLRVPSSGEAPPPETALDGSAPQPDEAGPFWIQMLFREMDAEHARLLGSVAIPRNLDPGDLLVREGEEGDSLFILVRGRLAARGTIEEEEMPLAVFAPGDIIGEVAFLKRVPRTATVTASERSMVLELPGPATRQALDACPDSVEHLEVLLQERVERTLSLIRRRGARSNGHSEN